MLLNENRGSLGMFSRAGRNSADKYSILVRKDEILAGTNKKIKFRSMYSPDDNNLNSEEADEDIDIFKSFKKERREGAKSQNLTKPRKNNKKPKSDITKYLEMRKKIKKKSENPACTKYNPKNAYVWKRIITGPKWDTANKKNFSRVKREVLDPPYKAPQNFKVEGKNFIDLARQTRRGSFSGSHNVRLTNVKSPIETSTNFNRTGSLSPKARTSNTFYRHESRSSNKNYNTGNQITHTYNSDEEYSVSKRKNKSQNKTHMNNTHSGTTNKWIKIQAPDFKKIISREQLDNIFGDKKTIIPFSFPNFKWTRPRPIMMVKYDQLMHKKHKNERPQTSDPFQNLNYDPYKVLDKVNNFKRVVTPNFNLMTSRPNDPDPLPSYMKKIHSRGGTEMMTEKALQMNNFSEGKFSTTATCFWPKKSFNKIINLNLLNSRKFKENVGLNMDDDNFKNNEFSDYIQKSMKFYNKNYDDLMKESMLNKFDNVTFKTIKRENKIDAVDLEKFLVNFDRVDP